MKHIVLSIGYHSSERKDVQREWIKHGVDFHFVDSIDEAAQRLSKMDYVCVTICSGHITDEQFNLLRNIKPVPIVVLSPKYSASKRAEYFQRGAADFLTNAKQWGDIQVGSKDAVKYYLDIPQKSEEPLTIITLGDLYFCLEYRTVEVQGNVIDLTAKEFDLLALLILHPKRVYTFEMIMDLIWGEEYTYFSRKTLINHMSNLRKKLKVQPDAPNYIVNVHGVGYKFDMG